MHRIITLIDLSTKMEQRLSAIYELLSRKMPLEENEIAVIDGDWYDNQDVMQLLKISSRTLLRRRHDGSIQSTQIKGKFYYRKSHIEEVLRKGLE